MSAEVTVGDEANILQGISYRGPTAGTLVSLEFLVPFRDYSLLEHLVSTLSLTTWDFFLKYCCQVTIPRERENGCSTWRSDFSKLPT